MVFRTRKCFRWPEGEGILFGDYDPSPATKHLNPEELIEALRSAVPELRIVTIAHRFSSSSHLMAPDGSILTGAKGQHLFMRVDRASDIPQIGALLSARLWVAGLGRFDVSANGSLLPRTILDSSVWQPERLVFIRAHCVDGVRQDIPPPTIFSGDLDDILEEVSIRLENLRPVSPEHSVALREAYATAREEVSGAAIASRERWLDDRARQAAGPEAKTEDIARIRVSMASSLDDGVLPADLALLSEDGETISVSELLADREKWHGRRFADPIEPDYRRDRRIARACLNERGRGYIYSHAHGGQRYLLTERAVPAPSSLDEFEDLTSIDQTIAAPRRFQVLTPANFVCGKPGSWIIKDLLPGGAVAMIFGPSGSGKSFLALDLAWSVASGQEWRGLRVAGGPVVYIIAEGVAGFRKRLQAYASHFEANLDDLDIGIVADTPDLCKDDYLLLGDEIERAGGASLIIVDTLAQVTAGADENSAEEMSSVLRRCTQLVERTGATVLLIHHSGKDESRGSRGWSGIRAALDVEIKVGRNGDSFFAKVTKQKDGVDQGEYAFQLQAIDLGSDEDGDRISSCVVKHLEAKFHIAVRGKWHRRVMQHMQLQDGFETDRSVLIESVMEASKALGEAPSPRCKESINRAIEELCRRGILCGNNGRVASPQTPQTAHNVDFVGSARTDAPHHTSL